MRVVSIRSLEERSTEVREGTLVERVAEWVRAQFREARSPDIEKRPSNGVARSWHDALPDEVRWLADAFGLTATELDVLLVGAAVERHPHVLDALASGNGQPHLRYLSWRALRALLGDDRLGVGRSGPLQRLRLVQEEDLGAAEPSLVRIDPFIVAYLLDQPEWDVKIAERLETIPDVTPLPSWQVSHWTRTVRARLERGPVRFWVSGPDGSGRRSFAQAVALGLESQALYVETRGLTDDEFHELRLRAVRQAVLLGQVMVWSSDAVQRPARPPALAAPLEFVVTLPNGNPSRGSDLQSELGLPNPDERRALWGRLIPETLAWSDAQRARLEGYRVHVGDVAGIARSGAHLFEEISSLCRRLSRGRMEDFAEILDCPFVREDLVLATSTREALDDFIHEAHARVGFWEKKSARRLFPRGRGLVGLLAGSPGTGKTMSAQVIAAELGLDLVRIDLATVVSKYIGETSKNLARVFRAAREMNAVLFFDEADALFSKRTEVKDSHDRYANADTNYLLQHLEDFDGVALLATNKKGNLDTAFVRRLRFILEFARPTATERLELYRTMLGQMAERVDPDLVARGLPGLSDSFDVTGAQIKLALLSAVFRAQREDASVGLQHVLVGLERELAKEGRALSRADRQRTLSRLGGVS